MTFVEENLLVYDRLNMNRHRLDDRFLVADSDRLNGIDRVSILAPCGERERFEMAEIGQRDVQPVHPFHINQVGRIQIGDSGGNDSINAGMNVLAYRVLSSNMPL